MNIGIINETVAHVNTTLKEEGNITYIKVTADYDEPSMPGEFCVYFDIPSINSYCSWNSMASPNRRVGASWRENMTESRLGCGMPLHCIISKDNRNCVCFSLNDVKTPCTLSAGILEEDTVLRCRVKFFFLKTTPITHYEAVIRVDFSDVMFYDAIYDVVSWWENECGCTPTEIPNAAYDAVDSLWYSFHQELTSESILEECRLSSKLGMKTVIIDDGWQTDNTIGGYDYCGDWEMCKKKIPDMAKLSDEIHKLGMKVMIWYSVPFLGRFTKNYDRFKNMVLNSDDKSNCFGLDPRYPEVREFLIKNYVDAVKNWHLDGLKLDFIDAFMVSSKGPVYDPNRDYVFLEDALDRLLFDVYSELKKVNKDVLIEFRQPYVGPSIRKYGNMLRVIDCPGDMVMNRRGVIDLRLTSGATAVHSDMIEWNVKDTPLNVAFSLVSVLFGVPQISVKISDITDDHKRVIKAFLDFWKDNRKTIMGGKLIALDPEAGYSFVSSEDDDKAVCCCYVSNVVDVKGKSVSVVNATGITNMIMNCEKAAQYTVKDYFGEIVSTGELAPGINRIDTPACAYIELKIL